MTTRYHGPSDFDRRQTWARILARGGTARASASDLSLVIAEWCRAYRERSR